LIDAVKPGAFDLALVAHDGPAFAATQAAREQAGGGWSGLGAGLRKKADRLAELATRGELALFVGAGVSAGAGIPLWGEMLDRLRPEADAWVLKMHGSVSHPEDIVLTREHQLAYEERHAALAGIVQTLLLTRHMLFVGFSLSDDTFHRIADDVRRVLRSLE